jgi:hypothetical protein
VERQVEAWGTADESDDEKLAVELEKVREFMLQPSEVRKRAMVDDTFLTAKQSYAWTQVRPREASEMMRLMLSGCARGPLRLLSGMRRDAGGPRWRAAGGAVPIDGR